MEMKMGVLMMMMMIVLGLGVCDGKTIVVGGSQGWHYGFNYTHWAIQNAPFHFNDKLVFKYQPPNPKSARPSVYTVYLLPNLWSYATCDFRYAKLLASPKKGGGHGFTVALTEWRPFYFASNGGNGRHCRDGLMKFAAVPLPSMK